MATCMSALNISKTAWAASSVDGSLDPNDQLSVYMSLVNNMQLPEAASLLDDILKNRQYSMQVFKASFEKSGLKGRLIFSKSGLLNIYLDKEKRDISDLRFFQKAHINILSLKDMPISDISVVEDLKIHTLDISGTRIARMPFLKKAKIEVINAASSRVQSLEDFIGLRLVKLDLSQCSILDIYQLPKFSTDELILAGCPAQNPQIVKASLTFHKNLVLPMVWKGDLKGLVGSSKIGWSKLDALIVR